jgi:hypothetical protein
MPEATGIRVLYSFLLSVSCPSPRFRLRPKRAPGIPAVTVTAGSGSRRLRGDGDVPLWRPNTCA